MASGVIKVKAMAFFHAEGRLLVSDGFDKVKQQSFYRLLGGHVEFGERSETALKREIVEELGADIEVLAQLDVIQNRFTYEGRQYHEIIFIHNARFLDESFNRRDDLRNLEADYDERFLWVPVAQALNGDIPLFPTADYRGFLARIGVTS